MTHNRNCMQTLKHFFVRGKSTHISVNCLIYSKCNFSKKFHNPKQIPVKKMLFMMVVHDCNNFVRLQGFFDRFMLV